MLSRISFPSRRLAPPVASPASPWLSCPRFTSPRKYIILGYLRTAQTEDCLYKILDRYIFAELLPPFLISLIALCFVMLTKELLRLVELLVSKGVGFLAVLDVFFHLLPSFLVLTLPIAGIIASITAFSRLSYDKELVAMRAAGLSLLRLSRPVMIFSCLVFGLTLALSQWGQPWTSVSLKKLALSLLRDQLTLALDKGVFNEPVPRMVMYVPDRAEGADAQGIFISDGRNPAEARIIVASRYALLNEPGNNQVGIRLIDGTIHSRPHDLTQYHQVSFSTYDLRVSLNQSLYAPADERPSRESVIERLDQTDWQDTDSLRRLMEYYKDLAFPTAALIFGMIGVPVGIVSKRSGRVGGFAVGVMVVIVYYVLNVLCEFFVTTLVLPPFAGAWLPNAVFLVAGIILFHRINQR
ncbi:MAG: LPS export ABC transporter permease LptF [Nitrospirae bacterium]|nr:MAG: LPS export ABC transporter permease LptF [Nitrospirota bacterium]